MHLLFLLLVELDARQKAVVLADLLDGRLELLLVCATRELLLVDRVVLSGPKRDE